MAKRALAGPRTPLARLAWGGQGPRHTAHATDTATRRRPGGACGAERGNSTCRSIKHQSKSILGLSTDQHASILHIQPVIHVVDTRDTQTAHSTSLGRPGSRHRKASRLPLRPPDRLSCPRLRRAARASGTRPHRGPGDSDAHTHARPLASTALPLPSSLLLNCVPAPVRAVLRPHPTRPLGSHAHPRASSLTTDLARAPGAALRPSHLRDT